MCWSICVYCASLNNPPNRSILFNLTNKHIIAIMRGRARATREANARKLLVLSCSAPHHRRHPHAHIHAHTPKIQYTIHTHIPDMMYPNEYAHMHFAIAMHGCSMSDVSEARKRVVVWGWRLPAFAHTHIWQIPFDRRSTIHNFADFLLHTSHTRRVMMQSTLRSACKMHMLIVNVWFAFNCRTQTNTHSNI